MKSGGYAYAGAELDVFKHARNWKRYWSAAIRPYLRGAVLEVGAGVGANSPFLTGPDVARLVRLEPDARFVERLDREGPPPHDSRIEISNRLGTLREMAAGERFDAILYLDVLEHIDDDRGELAAAAARLAPGGHLVVLAPAFQSLYSPFDKAIGHYRRYRRSTLARVAPPSLTVVRSQYLDGPGALLSAGNRLLLRHASPSGAQIAFWDTWVVPAARVIDPLMGRVFGRSVLCVWRMA
jgi:SAM-dependent methyltransferase